MTVVNFNVNGFNKEFKNTISPSYLSYQKAINRASHSAHNMTI
jgi:hypothetical protein